VVALLVCPGLQPFFFFTESHTKQKNFAHHRKIGMCGVLVEVLGKPWDGGRGEGAFFPLLLALIHTEITDILELLLCRRTSLTSPSVVVTLVSDFCLRRVRSDRSMSRSES